MNMIELSQLFIEKTQFFSKYTERLTKQLAIARFPVQYWFAALCTLIFFSSFKFI